jgi:aldehyde reductase
VNQVELHPALAQTELVQWCNAAGIAMTAYSPLGNPSLKEEGPAPMLHEKVVAIAQAHGKTAAQVVLRWNMQRGVVVIPKSVTPSRIEQNGGVYDWALSGEEMGTLAHVDAGHRQVDGMFWAKKGQTYQEIWA